MSPHSSMRCTNSTRQSERERLKGVHRKGMYRYDIRIYDIGIHGSNSAGMGVQGQGMGIDGGRGRRLLRARSIMTSCIPGVRSAWHCVQY